MELSKHSVPRLFFVCVFKPTSVNLHVLCNFGLDSGSKSKLLSVLLLSPIFQHQIFCQHAMSDKLFLSHFLWVWEHLISNL